MAVFSNTPITSYWSGSAPVGADAVTRREWLLNELAYVNYVDTFLLNNLRKVNIDTVYPEWVMDMIEDPRTVHSNATVTTSTNTDILATEEGAEIDPALPTSRVRGANYTHIWHKAFRVSDIQRQMNEVAVADEYGQQAWKAGLQLVNGFEYLLLWSQAAPGTASVTDTDARKMHGVIGWAATTGKDGNEVQIAGRYLPNDYSSTYYSGTSSDLTPDELYDDILTPFVDKGNQLDMCFAMGSAKVKRVLSGFSMAYSGSGATLTATPINERTVPAAANTVHMPIDIFQTDLGPLYVTWSRQMNGPEVRTDFGSVTGTPGTISIDADEALIIMNPEYLEIGVLQGVHVRPLPAPTLSSQAAVVATMSLICKNPRALALAIEVAA